ncbi:MAG: FG-GAP-like repeat-containing protein [Polyangia bacterium]
MASHRSSVAWLLGLLGLGCGGTMDTGVVEQLASNKPGANGSCPSGQNLCGSGLFAICTDLQSDPNHCGSCARACSPGVACQAGVCQQTVCTGTTMPFSSQGTISSGPVCSGGSPTSPTVLYAYPSQALADVNGDGLLDFISWHPLTDPFYGDGCNSEFQVALGQPAGGFGPPSSYQAIDAIIRVFVTDVNGDGLADLYVVSWTWMNSPVNPYHVQVWLGQKDGQLQLDAVAGLRNVESLSDGSEIAIGDLSGDGWPDLVIESPQDDTSLPGPEISVYLSDATGALHLSQTFDASSMYTFIADMNGDGSPDLMLLSGDIELLYNRGDGTFAPPVDCADAVAGGRVGEQDILVADFNRDGWMDLAFEGVAGGYVGLGGSQVVSVMLGSGGCGFSPISYYGVPSQGFLRAADMNGDGILDIASVSAVISATAAGQDGLLPTYTVTDNLLAVLLGNGDGTFHLANPAISLGANEISDVTIGEVTGDQRPDIVISSTNGQTAQVGTWENTCQ